MRWDNITVVYGVHFYGHLWIQFKALGPCGPLGFKLNPLVPIEKYSVHYRNIIPPHYDTPHIVNSYFHTPRLFLAPLLHTTISLLYLDYEANFASVHFHYWGVQVIFITVTLW